MLTLDEPGVSRRRSVGGTKAGWTVLGMLACAFAIAGPLVFGLTRGGRPDRLVLASAPDAVARTSAGEPRDAFENVPSGAVPDGRTYGGLPTHTATVEETLARAPDFIPVANENETAVAGYVDKWKFFSRSADGLEVYTTDLETLVGHWIRGVGFVPLGVDPYSLSLDDAELDERADAMDREDTRFLPSE